jgi:hypothetical protein
LEVWGKFPLFKFWLTNSKVHKMRVNKIEERLYIKTKHKKINFTQNLHIIRITRLNCELYF